MRENERRPWASDEVAERLLDEGDKARAEREALRLELGRPLDEPRPVGPVGRDAERECEPLVARSLVAVVGALEDDGRLGRGRGGRGGADGSLLAAPARTALDDARDAGDREVARGGRVTGLGAGVAAEGKQKGNQSQSEPL